MYLRKRVVGTVKKKRAAVLLPIVFGPDKTPAASFLKGFENVPQKACPSGVRLPYYHSLYKTKSVLSGYKAHARDVLSVF